MLKILHSQINAKPTIVTDWFAKGSIINYQCTYSFFKITLLVSSILLLWCVVMFIERQADDDTPQSHTSTLSTVYQDKLDQIKNILFYAACLSFLLYMLTAPCSLQQTFWMPSPFYAPSFLKNSNILLLQWLNKYLL